MTTTGPRRWLLYCLLAIVIFGVWGVVGKAAETSIKNAAGEAATPATFNAVQTAGLLPVMLLLLLSPGLKAPGSSPRPNRALGAALGFAAGLCGAVGNFALILSWSGGGEASVVQPLTGMYPLVTVLLAAVLLRERLNAVQVLGIVLAAGAFYLFGVAGLEGTDGSSAAAGARDWRATLAAPWMLYALAALVLWGVLAVIQKVATRHVSSELCTICFAAASVPVAVALAAVKSVQWQLPAGAWALGLLFGALLAVGTLVTFAAYRTGKASVVTAVYALYPAVTVLIAVPLFGEAMGWRKAGAIALALAAGVALSFERPASAPGNVATN